MKDIVIALAICAAFLGLVFWLDSVPHYKGYFTQDEACQAYYGQDYQFVDGDRSPDMCVNSNGESKFYQIIPEKEIK